MRHTGPGIPWFPLFSHYSLEYEQVYPIPNNIHHGDEWFNYSVVALPRRWRVASFFIAWFFDQFSCMCCVFFKIVDIKNRKNTEFKTLISAHFRFFELSLGLTDFRPNCDCRLLRQKDRYILSNMWIVVAINYWKTQISPTFLAHIRSWSFLGNCK